MDGGHRWVWPVAAATSAAAYAIIKIVWLFNDGVPFLFPDSPGYYIVDWPRFGRPLVASLLFGVLGPSRLAVGVVAAVSIVANLSLTVVLWMTFPRTRILALLVPAISLIPGVLVWDGLVLTESLATSGVLVLIAATVALANESLSTAAIATLLCSGIALSVGTKDSMALFALAAVGAAGYALVMRRNRGSPEDGTRWVWAAASGALLVLLVGFNLYASNNPVKVWMNHEVPAAVEARVSTSSIRTMNIVFEYVLIDPAVASRWFDAGMPTPQLSGAVDDPLARRFTDTEFAEWVDANAERLWVGELLRNPLAAARRTNQIDVARSRSSDFYALVLDTPSFMRWADRVVPHDLPAQLLMDGMVLVLAVAGLRSRPSPRRGFDRSADTTPTTGEKAVGVGLVLLALAQAVHPFVVVNLDTVEAWRHNLVAMTTAPPLLVAAAMFALRNAPAFPMASWRIRRSSAPSPGEAPDSRPTRRLRP